MKITYRANDWLGTEFDDPISCQIYEKLHNFLDAQSADSEWQNLHDESVGFSQTQYALKDLVIHRKLFMQLMSKIAEAEANM